MFALNKSEITHYEKLIGQKQCVKQKMKHSYLNLEFNKKMNNH